MQQPSIMHVCTTVLSCDEKRRPRYKAIQDKMGRHWQATSLLQEGILCPLAAPLHAAGQKYKCKQWQQAQSLQNLSKPGQHQVCSMDSSPALLVGSMPAAPGDSHPAAAALAALPLLQIPGAANHPQVVFVIAGALPLPRAAGTDKEARVLQQEGVQVQIHLCLSTCC